MLYLFNPLPESGLRRVMASLERSLSAHPRAVYVLYHNPLLERVLSERGDVDEDGRDAPVLHLRLHGKNRLEA